MACAWTSAASAAGEPPRRSGRSRVRVWRGVRQVRLPAVAIIRALNRIGRHEASRGQVHVIIVDDPLMHDLNRRFRRRDRPTDVLAFPLTSGQVATGDGLLGEIYCNYDHARRWRMEHGGTVAAELIRLAVHGYLHLLGYDHHTIDERRRMVDAEDRYLVDDGLIARRSQGMPTRPLQSRGRTRRG